MSMTGIAVMCAWMVANTAVQKDEVKPRTEVCEAIGEAAQAAGEDPAVLISLGWHESRYARKVTSHKGAQGPLQVIPGYWCPGRTVKGCDLIKAGVRAYTTYRKKHKGLRETLCHYNSGNVCYPKSYSYADSVIRKAKAVRRQVRLVTASLFQ